MIHNLLILKSHAAKISAKFKPSHKEKKEMRKGNMFAMAGRAGERNGKSVGCRELGPMLERGQTPGPVLFFGVMLIWDCAMMPLSAHSPVILTAPLSFLERQLEELLHRRQIPRYPFSPLPPARKVCDFAAGAGYQQ